MKQTHFILLFVLISSGLYAQKNENFNPDEKFLPDSLRSITLDIMNGISNNHPGFYRYTSKAEFDLLIDSTCQTINDSLGTIAYYRKLKPLFAKIGCLHTSIGLSEQYTDYISKTFPLIPIEIFINDNRKAFVTKDYSENQQLPLKSEILSINGKSMSEILTILYSAVPSDGHNQTLKTLMLNYRFAFWYQTMISLTDTFDIEVKINDQIQNFHLAGVSEEVFPSFDSIEHAHEKQVKFEIRENTGYLTIHSFANTAIRKNGQKFERSIREIFKTLDQQQINDLVIDLRNNTGGSDGNARYFSSYFFDEPYRYWKQIETTEEIAKQVKGIYRLFYKKPQQVDTTYHWKGAHWWLSQEFSYYKIQEPAEKYNYQGNVYLITNGACMSSCADVVAILSHNDKAKVIGQETGGGFQGNTSGMMPTTEVHPHLRITTPLQKYTNAVDLTKNHGRGTIPDYIVAPTLEDWIEGKDVQLEYVNKLIRDNQK